MGWKLGSDADGIDENKVANAYVIIPNVAIEHARNTLTHAVLCAGWVIDETGEVFDVQHFSTEPDVLMKLVGSFSTTRPF